MTHRAAGDGQLDGGEHQRPHLARLRGTGTRDGARDVSACDACYVAVAEALGCPLVTGGARLAAATGPRCEIRVLRTEDV